MALVLWINKAGRVDHGLRQIAQGLCSGRLCRQWVSQQGWIGTGVKIYQIRWVQQITNRSDCQAHDAASHPGDHRSRPPTARPMPAPTAVNPQKPSLPFHPAAAGATKPSNRADPTTSLTARLRTDLPGAAWGSDPETNLQIRPMMFSW